VEVGLVGGASKEAYVVSLQREGGMRAIDIRLVLELDPHLYLLYLLYWYKKVLAYWYKRSRS